MYSFAIVYGSYGVDLAHAQQLHLEGAAHTAAQAGADTRDRVVARLHYRARLR